MNYEWTKMEEFVLSSNFGKVPLDQLAVMLPNRTRGAITNRALQLGLHKERKQPTVVRENDMNSINTLEKLETEVAVKRALLEIEKADRELAINDELLVNQYDGSDPKNFITVNSKQRGKLVAALSRARLKLVQARMAQKALSKS